MTGIKEVILQFYYYLGSSIAVFLAKKGRKKRRRKVCVGFKSRRKLGFGDLKVFFNFS